MAQLQHYTAPCSHACNIDGTHLALVLMCPLVQLGGNDSLSAAVLPRLLQSSLCGLEITGFPLNGWELQLVKPLQRKQSNDNHQAL